MKTERKNYEVNEDSLKWKKERRQKRMEIEREKSYEVNEDSLKWKNERRQKRMKIERWFFFRKLKQTTEIKWFQREETPQHSRNIKT